MSARFSRRLSLSRAAAIVALLALAAGASGCAQIGDAAPSAFADPAKYELYDCKQLEAERKALIDRAKQQEAWLAKAQTGVGGAVVGEMVYRNELISIHAQQKLAEEAWRRNNCHETPPPSAAPTPTPTPTPTPKGSRQPRSLIH
ncbi:twin-arginine translocation pathway signal [Bradyrhizobium genosp. P]|uniref:twin-arginine translocation pathway signal n=1 Tax=Bradyrhizobium genosp. P TaxID=83641 RepID=UPI003CF6892A